MRIGARPFSCVDLSGSDAKTRALVTTNDKLRTAKRRDRLNRLGDESAVEVDISSLTGCVTFTPAQDGCCTTLVNRRLSTDSKTLNSGAPVRRNQSRQICSRSWMAGLKSGEISVVLRLVPVRQSPTLYHVTRRQTSISLSQ